MKLYHIFLGILLGFTQPGAAQTDHFMSFSTEVEKIQKKFKIPNHELGLFLSYEDGIDTKVLLSQNASQKMIPASISKILTASAVLNAFPPGTKFKTRLYITGPRELQTLKGNLYLKGGGDPGFVSENMWFLVNHFLREGIKKIEGDIIVDDTLFDQKRFDESRQSTRVDRAYDSPVGAMSFNWNSVNIFVRPGESINRPAQVSIDPENEYIQLINRTKTIAGSANKIIVERKSTNQHPGDTVIVSGQIGMKSQELVIFKNITNPDLWSGYNLKSFLSQRGILVTGKIRAGSVPQSAQLVAEAESKPTELMVSDMNKFSNNYVAEMLTKLIHSQKKQPATLKGGVELINQYLVSLGIPQSEYEFYNPSGLTRENLISPQSMGLVLKKMKQDFQVQPEFLTSLPISGIDGTLKRRLKGTDGERWVRAKTGYLTGVITLAGYVGCRSGLVGEFAFIFNGKTDEGKVRQFFDEVLLEFIDQCPN